MIYENVQLTTLSTHHSNWQAWIEDLALPLKSGMELGEPDVTTFQEYFASVKEWMRASVLLFSWRECGGGQDQPLVPLSGTWIEVKFDITQRHKSREIL